MIAEKPPIRFGVIGAGWFASRRHIPDIRSHPEAALDALCRRDRSALERLAEHFQPAATFTDWQEMLAQRSLDAVVIATPPAQHYEQALAAVEAGLHVLLEKPMTLTSAQARHLCSQAAHRNVHLAVALNPPYWAHCHRMRALVRQGRVGEIEAIQMFWTGNADYVFGRAPKPADLPGVVPPTLFRADPALSGGGYLMDGGPHLISEVLWVTGLRATRVACTMDTVPQDRRASLAITLENGSVAAVCSVGDSRYPTRRVCNTFAGTLGTLSVEGFEFRTTLVRRDAEPEVFAEAELPAVPGPVANLIDAIRGRSELFSPCSHGAHVTEVLEAAYRSAIEHQVIAIPGSG
ncbi:MAG: Gfo/Idh/MocA family protein [Chthonomonadales bacterium]